MRNCMICGSPVQDGAVFCGVCGARQDGAPAQPAQPQPQQPPVYQPGSMPTQQPMAPPPPAAPQQQGYAQGGAPYTQPSAPQPMPPAQSVYPQQQAYPSAQGGYPGMGGAVPPQGPYGAPPPAGPPPKKKKTGMILGIVAGALAVVILAVVLVMVFTNGEDETVSSIGRQASSRSRKARSSSEEEVSSQVSSMEEEKLGYTWLMDLTGDVELVEPIYNSQIVPGATAFLNFKVGSKWGVMTFDGTEIFAPYNGKMMFCDYGEAHGLPPQYDDMFPDIDAINDALADAGFPFETNGDHGFGSPLVFGYDPANGDMTLGFFGFGEFYPIEDAGLDESDIEMEYIQVIDLSDSTDGVPNGTYVGLATRDGELLLPVEYDGIRYAVNGVCTLQKNGLYGYYSTDRRARGAACIYEPLYTFDDSYSPDNAGWFSSGLCPVRQDGLVGFIDDGGNFVLEPQFENATQVMDGEAWVQLDETWSLIAID